MMGDVELTYEGVTLKWSIDTIGVGGEGRYLLLDEEGDPRLFLDKEELVQIQRGEQ